MFFTANIDQITVPAPENQHLRDGTSSDSEDDGPRKKFGKRHAHGESRRQKVVQNALKELGQEAHYSGPIAWTGFVFALAAAGVGVCWPDDEIQTTYRAFCLMAGVFIVNQAFLFVKTVRDGEIMSMKDHHGRICPEFHFLQGAMPSELAPHRVVCFASLILAILGQTYGIITMKIEKSEGKMFMALGSLYLLSASLNLAWLLRDRFESSIWKDETNPPRFIGSTKVELAMRNVIKVLSNMQFAIKAMFFFCGATSIALTSFAIVHFEVQEKGVGLVVSGLVSSVFAAWFMAQAMNDESMQGDSQKMHRGMSVFFFCAAVALTVAGIVEMKIEWNKRAVLGLGVVITLDATLNFSKVVYRLSAVKKVVKTVEKRFKISVNLEDHSEHAFQSGLTNLQSAFQTTDTGYGGQPQFTPDPYGTQPGPYDTGANHYMPPGGGYGPPHGDQYAPLNPQPY